MNNRIYPKEVFEKEVEKYVQKMMTMYCPDCCSIRLEPGHFIMDIKCGQCGSKKESVTYQQLREVKINKLLNEK